MTHCHDDMQHIIPIFAPEFSNNQTSTTMAKIFTYGLEVDFPALSVDQLAEYATHYAMVSIPQSCVYMAWKADTHEHNVFLHYLISHFEEIGMVCQGRLFECDLEPKGDRQGRSIFLCSFCYQDAAAMLEKFMKSYCGCNYIIMRPWWVAEGLRVKGGK